MSQSSDTFCRHSRAERFDESYPHFPAMREALRSTLLRLVSDIERFERPIGSMRLVGVELETSCVRSDGHTLDQRIRDQLVEANLSRGWQKELGAAQIELAPDPVDVTAAGGFTTLKRLILSESAHLREELALHDARPIRMGSDPIVEVDERCRTRGVERYLLVPDFHRDNRRAGMPATIGVGHTQIRTENPTAVGACSTIQATIDCMGIKDGLDMLNASFEVGPYAVALSANARFLNGLDTGFADIRSALWETSHDVRTWGEVVTGHSTRSGLPSHYFNSVEAYAQDLFDQPSILDNPDAAIEIAVGLYWREARLKFLRHTEERPQLAVEFRPVSLQPTPFEDYAMIAFAVGLIHVFTTSPLPRLPLHLVQDNRWSAMVHGLRGKLWIMTEDGPKLRSGMDVLRQMIERAADGLSRLGANKEEINEVREVWSDRLTDGCPSDVLFAELKEQWSKSLDGSRPIHRELLREQILKPVFSPYDQ